jgi:hypothetical protein
VNTFSTTAGTLTFGVPGEGERLHFAEAEQARLDAWVESCLTEDEEPLFGDEEEIDIAISPVNYGVTWWHAYDECAGGENCECGPVTLLEALSWFEPGEGASLFNTHQEQGRALFDHFWSGHALCEGETTSIGDACANCLVEGFNHVWDVFDNAAKLAEETGEVLAAYEHTVVLGVNRFSEHARHDSRNPKRGEHGL